MNKRFIGVLIFAFVVATAGGLLTYRSLISRAPVTKEATPTVQLALAARDLELGSVLKEDDIRLAAWPGTPPTGATSRVQDLVGRGVITAMYAKEPILESRLAPKGAGGGLAAMIPPGMRAVPVRVNEVVGVAGFVVPGMRVDVIINGNSPAGNGRLGVLSKTLLQNVEVLSAGQDYKKDPEGKPVVVQVVNLLVTPTDAERLSLATNQTSLQLVLRNPLDRDVTKTPGTAVSQLFSGGKFKMPDASGGGGDDDAEKPRARPPVRAAAPAAVPEAPLPPRKEPPFVMEVISGTKKTEVKFENGGEGK